jgi:hypothetical protein
MGTEHFTVGPAAVVAVAGLLKSNVPTWHSAARTCRVEITPLEIWKLAQREVLPSGIDVPGKWGSR